MKNTAHIKKVLLDTLEILDSFDYGERFEGGDLANFEARLSVDWFFHTKNKLEKIIRSDERNT